MKPLLSELARLLPDLALLFPDLVSGPTSLVADPEQEKRRFFAVLTHFFTEQAAHHPVLLIVEDIHWCDDLSLDFLLHLARRGPQMPLLLLLTYRSDELHPRLRQWLTQLDRERLAQECSLERFSRSDVAAMLQAILEMKQGVDADLLDTLYARSEGNPFFVEELLKLLMTTGELVRVDGTWKRTAHRASVPRSIQEAVQQRTAHLSVDAKRLLTLAAVAGRRFNVTLLQEVMHCDEGQLLARLKEVMAAQLVVEEAADQFAFRHALTQQAIYAELLVRERQGLHRSIAQTLERLSTPAPTSRERYLEDLASHCYEAGMWEQALAYAQEVGEKALTLYAQQAAIDQVMARPKSTPGRSALSHSCAYKNASMQIHHGSCSNRDRQSGCESPGVLSLRGCAFSIARQAGQIVERQWSGNILNYGYRNRQWVTEKQAQKAKSCQLQCRAS